MSKHGYAVTQAQLCKLLEEIVRARAPDQLSLITRLGHASFSPEDREALRETLSEELVEEGLGPDDEPNSRGRLIEAAIDWLGHQ